ncbi:LPXTG-motif cell wall anchor domain-containing protein [Bacillus sp. 71mf]|uniref:Cna B-type domain-containing protein n=2 Tax=unclassified Bacillus (in: firmicutes) TaxID=185979 RepID=UPI0008E3CC9F|nr:Cna B-type domain-containing protein [Bacillus sp. 103mf]SFJ87129.1 LPXTG-motif cell wall anchor domain-containing protein [Bacillus sp. 71mf]SFS56559.1 LPXTG-motif cell wall anchor domain-containing protein [Bacillus sp. 103mf]
MPIIAKAQELNTSGFVDSFTFDKTDLSYGERTGIKVNFSDKSGNKMKAGDTLTLTLPQELQGYSRKIDLKNDAGVTFGTCQVTTTNVLCTFTDVVEKLRNIRGYFYFEVQATQNVATGQTITVDTNLGTNLQTQRVTIKGPTEGGESTAPFSYKTGRIDPDTPTKVKWELPINNNKEQLSSDIVLSDTSQSGQTLDQAGFTLIVGNEALTPQQFIDKGYGTITFNSNSFEIRAYKDQVSGKIFILRYTATITENGMSQENFFNDFTINYQILNEQPVTFSDSAWTKNINAGGGAQGDLPPKGTLRIIKHIAGDETKFIPNVSFKLYTESGQQIGSTYTTDAQGMVEVPTLNPGNYYVQEITAPNYLDFDPQAKVPFTIDANAEKGVKLMVPNKVKSTSILGAKAWKDNNATDRPATIKVDLLQNGQVVDTKDVTAANNWNYTFADIPAYDNDGNAYTYTVREQSVAGYKSEVNGYNITNTKVGQTKVEGTKAWKDNNAIDRPSTIKVDLLQSGQVIDTKDVTASNNWKYTFDNLQAYDANGVAYKYEVKEQPVDGYKSEVKGYDITNTKVGQTTVAGTKTWKDGNATDRPATIQVDLLQNGNVIQTQDVTASNNWKYTFTNLEAYDVNGVAYTYIVKEHPVVGYKSEVNGYDITNTKVGKTTVTGTKTWKDNNATDRPTTIQVDLLQNGTVIQTQEVTAANNWNYTFADLAQYDANGVPYTYTVKEHPVAGYKSEVNGYNITNTKVAKLTVEGTKTWKDGNAIDRPAMIQVDLLQNGNVIQTQDVPAAMGWKYVFADLEAYDANGVAYTYTVKEHPVAGYQSSVSGYDITNTKVGQTKVEGTKTWNDNNATDRPGSVKIDLLQNGQVVDTKEVTAATNWKYTFDNLQAYDANGVAYTYTVKEQPVAGYQSEVKGYDITNTKVGQTKVEGTKTWNDSNATDRPSTIKVDLLQNGQVIDTKDVTASTNWKYTFDNLQAYDANGVAYKYEVKEQLVDGYKSEVNGYDITNTKVGKTTVEGIKTWNDNSATDRPSTIKVDLLQNGQVIDTKEVTASNNWKYTFADLAAYDANGVAYKYEVKEQPVAGYQSEVKGYDITNTKVGQTKVEGTKTWNDNNATDRPSTIKVDLLQNGQVIDTKDVTASNNWKYTFDNLQAYDANGVAYKYEVKEQPVTGYKSEVNGYDITNTKVGQTKVEGTKTWKDNNATDRPSTIKVDLLQNGQVIDTKDVTAAKNWKYTFDNLQSYDANGVAYKYEVKEQPVDGYKSEVNGYDITNTKVGKTIVEGTKTWKDDNATGRPITIKVDLLQNGQVIGTKEVTEASGWKYAFTGLEAYDVDGKAYKYEVKEQPVAGYKSEVNGYDITNTKIKEPTPEVPKDNTNNDPNNDPKVPSIKENDNTTVLLPKTGGTPAEMISMVGGMVLFVLGGMLFLRQRVK